MTEVTLLGSFRVGFVRNTILGALLIITALLFWKLLAFTGVIAVFPLLGDWVKVLGLPPVPGRLMAVILVVTVVGALGWSVRRSIGSRRERFPVLSHVMSAEEQLHAFLRSDQGTKQDRVAFVNWPTPEVRTLGIITRTLVDSNSGRDLALVYMPNTPNPTSGILRLVDRDQLTVTDLSIANACAMCFSRGAAAGHDATFTLRAPSDKPSDQPESP